MKDVKKTGPKQILIYVLFAVLLILFLVPFALVLLNSFKPNKEIILSPLALPKEINLQGYVKAFGSMNYVQTFSNSLVITVLSIVFIILFAVNAVDNIFMVVVFYVGAHISMAVFMFQGFIKGIPVELDEAATIDGCGQFQILFKIVFPLLKPIISTVAVLDILAIWNDFLLPYILLQSNRLKTLPLMTYSFFGQYSVDYSLVCSGLIMSILPVIIIYIFLQKQIIEGVVAGAIK